MLCDLRNFLPNYVQIISYGLKTFWFVFLLLSFSCIIIIIIIISQRLGHIVSFQDDRLLALCKNEKIKLP